MTEIEDLRKKVNDLEKSIQTLQAGGKPPKRHRPPSEFNLFVGDKIKEIKAKHPTMSHKEVFGEAVSLWNKTKKK